MKQMERLRWAGRKRCTHKRKAGGNTSGRLIISNVMNANDWPGT